MATQAERFNKFVEMVKARAKGFDLKWHIRVAKATYTSEEGGSLSLEVSLVVPSEEGEDTMVPLFECPFSVSADTLDAMKGSQALDMCQHMIDTARSDVQGWLVDIICPPTDETELETPSVN